MNLLQNLKDYFNNNSKEQVIKDWEKTREADKVGSTIEQFEELSEEESKYIDWVLNNFHKNMDENHWDGE